ncbi:MAG: translation initiation factor IF-2 subunit alpha [Candidatus Micrarchaeota archaeon]|nr:translation initiation factor IF-2 subunit alpha [Candidatus Micrarchaeota archaeon]
MPKQGELVIATIKKIYPYGAFCTLDEYDGQEAFLHVSEIAPRWIKNIHEHVREGQKVIAQVYRYLPDKNQIDLTIKRVSESDKVWKREQYRRSNRARKLLEIAAKRLKKDKAKFSEEVAPALEKAFGSVYEGLEALSFEPEKARAKLAGLNEKALGALEEIAKENIKRQKVNISKSIRLECFEPDGVERIRAALAYSPSGKVNMGIKYTGAPLYKVDIEADDYKAAEKEMAQLLEHIRKTMGKCKHKLEVSE